MTGTRVEFMIAYLLVCCMTVTESLERKTVLEDPNEKYDATSAILSDEEKRVLKTLLFYDEAKMNDENKDCNGKTDIYPGCADFVKSSGHSACERAAVRDVRCPASCCKHKADPCFAGKDEHYECTEKLTDGLWSCTDTDVRTKKCRFTCAKCKGFTDPCKDDDPECPDKIANRYWSCDWSTKKKCRKTCGSGCQSTDPCKDDDPECPDKIASNEWSCNFSTRKKCRKTCGRWCKKPCRDKGKHCAQQIEWGLDTCSDADTRGDHCRATCGDCCKDMDPRCKDKLATGEWSCDDVKEDKCRGSCLDEGCSEIRSPCKNDGDYPQCASMVKSGIWSCDDEHTKNDVCPFTCNYCKKQN